MNPRTTLCISVGHFFKFRIPIENFIYLFFLKYPKYFVEINKKKKRICNLILQYLIEKADLWFPFHEIDLNKVFQSRNTHHICNNITDYHKSAIFVCRNTIALQNQRDISHMKAEYHFSFEWIYIFHFHIE